MDTDSQQFAVMEAIIILQGISEGVQFSQNALDNCITDLYNVHEAIGAAPLSSSANSDPLDQMIFKIEDYR